MAQTSKPLLLHEPRLLPVSDLSEGAEHLSRGVNRTFCTSKNSALGKTERENRSSLCWKRPGDGSVQAAAEGMAVTQGLVKPSLLSSRAMSQSVIPSPHSCPVLLHPRCRISRLPMLASRAACSGLSEAALPDRAPLLPRARSSWSPAQERLCQPSVTTFAVDFKGPYLTCQMNCTKEPKTQNVFFNNTFDCIVPCNLLYINVSGLQGNGPPTHCLAFMPDCNFLCTEIVAWFQYWFFWVPETKTMMEMLLSLRAGQPPKSK